MNEQIMETLGFGQAVKDKANCICPICKIKIDPFADFRNGISYKEWRISGLCQSCQDKIFGGDNGE